MDMEDHALAVTTSTTAGHEILETFTLVVNNVHKYSSPSDWEKYIKSKLPNDLFKSYKCKKVPNRDVGFVIFHDEVDLQGALMILSAAEFKGRKLEAFQKTGSAKDDKRKQDSRDNRNENNNRKREREDSGEGQIETSSSSSSSGDKDDTKRLRRTGKDATAPWHDVPYEEQLTRKMQAMRDEAIIPLLRKIKKSYTDADAPKPTWLKGILEETCGMMTVEPILPSPVLPGYRNKCEFTFGKDYQGLPSLGFRCSSFHEGIIVDPPDDVPTVPNAMKLVVRALNSFLKDSPLPIYDLHEHTGVWRLCTIRYSRRTSQMSVLLVVCLGGVEASAWVSEVDRLRKTLAGLTRDEFTDPIEEHEVESPSSAEEAAAIGSGSETKSKSSSIVTSCVYVSYDGASVAPTDLPLRRIIPTIGQGAGAGAGVDTQSTSADIDSTALDGSVNEVLLGANFKVAPTAFFQVSQYIYEVQMYYMKNA